MQHIVSHDHASLFDSHSLQSALTTDDSVGRSLRFRPWRNVHLDIYSGASNALVLGLMPHLYHFLTLLIAGDDW